MVDARVTDVDPAVFSSGLKPIKTVDQLASEGMRPVESLLPELVVTPLKLEVQDGPRYWLGLQNFYVITRYNHSAMYAMAYIAL